MADDNVRTNMMGMDTRYANANKWFAYLPLELILGKKFNNLELNITTFTLPQMEQGSTEVSFKGYSKTIPTRVINAGTKQLTIEYIVDENWKNYKALYAWMSSLEGAYPQMTDVITDSIIPENYINLKIYMLDSYKNKVIEFEFENCWVLVFNDLSLDVNNPEEVKHSFTFCYDIFRINSI